MSVTSSWGYTNGTSQVTTGIKMPIITSDDYAEVMRESSSNKKTVAQYRNLTTPSNQGEYVQLRAERRTKISKSYGTAYPPSTPDGYMFSIKREATLRVTDDQGIQTDNPIAITITCVAGDGTFVSGGITSGADWLHEIQRTLAVSGLAGVYDESDAAITVDQSSQPAFDKLMHTVADFSSNITTQA